MKIKNEFILKEVANEVIVVPTGKASVSFQGMMTLNKTAKFLFEALQEDMTLEDLVILLTKTYDISYEEAYKDVKAFIDLLESKKMLDAA